MEKFRAKDMNGNWIYSKDGKKSIRYVRDNIFLNDQSVTNLSQYVNRKDDKSGEEIYVGDIIERTSLEYRGNDVTDDVTEIILIQSIAIEYFDESVIEVKKLGNIFDNPELWQNHLITMSMDIDDN